jgi:hypothetical protein
MHIFRISTRFEAFFFETRNRLIKRVSHTALEKDDKQRGVEDAGPYFSSEQLRAFMGKPSSPITSPQLLTPGAQLDCSKIFLGEQFATQSILWYAQMRSIVPSYRSGRYCICKYLKPIFLRNLCACTKKGHVRVATMRNGSHAVSIPVNKAK